MNPPSRPDQPWTHTGAVLAGGAGRRMGRPKHELVLPTGRTMLETVATVLGEVCARVVVVGEVETALPRVLDLRPDQGPLGGIEALLASGLDSEYLVCPCDVPLVTASLLTRLVETPQAPASVFQLEGDDGFFPLPARISAGLLDRVRAHLHAQKRAVHRLVGSIDAEVIPLGSAEARQLANANTRQEYEAISRAWTRPGDDETVDPAPSGQGM
ncbi:MAG: molybdenum cofactor guanylyltransferase [Planctomycetota bacterium]|jgi:molybdopterin-guanine dinucleotide biosynthesis protein A